jgi:hypothetical protein
VDTEGFGRFGEVPVILLQDLPDESLFELADGILKKDVVFD